LGFICKYKGFVEGFNQKTFKLPELAKRKGGDSDNIRKNKEFRD